MGKSLFVGQLQRSFHNPLHIPPTLTALDHVRIWELDSGILAPHFASPIVGSVLVNRSNRASPALAAQRARMRKISCRGCWALSGVEETHASSLSEVSGEPRLLFWLNELCCTGGGKWRERAVTCSIALGSLTAGQWC